MSPPLWRRPAHEIVWGVAGAGAAGLATIGTRFAMARVLNRGHRWRSWNGEDPPSDPRAPNGGFGRAVAWAVATGVVASLAAFAARRLAASGWKRTVGRFPPA